MDPIKQKINAAIVALALLVAASLGLAYEVYAAGQVEPDYHMNYQQAVKATAGDCCQ